MHVCAVVEVVGTLGEGKRYEAGISQCVATASLSVSVRENGGARR